LPASLQTPPLRPAAPGPVGRDLATLTAALPEAVCLGPAGPRTITALADHTAAVTPGSLFACVPGSAADGHRFAGPAVAAGAAALLVDRALPELAETPQILVPDVRGALAHLAKAFHGHPDRQLHVLAVTGTNGKTTTAFMCHAVWAAARRPAALLGTVCYRVPGREEPAALTTPGPIALYGHLAEAVRGGAVAVALEASSHALEQKRLEGLEVDTAIFTNLSRDHLDYHGTPMAYFAAKRRLFGPRPGGKPHPAVAVVGTDGAAGRLIAREARACRQVITYGLHDRAEVAGRYHLDGRGRPVLSVEGPWGRGELCLPLPGPHNARNALAALAAAAAAGIPFDPAAHALSTLPPVPGRFEPVDAGQPFSVLVDFAHNPDGLRHLLLAARPGCAGTLRLVFGCKGGDGDAGKRRRMGEIAARFADVVYLTTDDPYAEDPAAIAAEVMGGIRARGGSATVVLDRPSAIRRAILEAEPGDLVAVAGRGHEIFQFVNGGRVPCDDRALCRAAAAEWLDGRGRVAAGG
jgi:UDP-N-acetylmuramoyl-L-alanyl-D-glutamate--2,6-diaminopimelate ligase